MKVTFIISTLFFLLIGAITGNILLSMSLLKIASRRRSSSILSHKRCSSTVTQPTPFLCVRMQNDSKLKERVERIQKEYEIYEYFSEFTPKLFDDKQWAMTLNCNSVLDRVNYWAFLSMTQHKKELDAIKHDREQEVTENCFKEQERLYKAGGMGYSDDAYCMLTNSYYGKNYASRKCNFIEESKNLATQLTLGESPHILFDCQYFPQMNLKTYGRVANSAKHTYAINRAMSSPFPHSFINVRPKDRNTMDFFLYKIANISTSKNWTVRPDLHTGDPFHNPNETDPRKQVVYLSKHASEFMDGPLLHKAYVLPFTFDTEQASFGAIKKGNYKGLAIPIRKYMNWKSGPIFLSWIVLLQVLDQVRRNGGDWEHALKNLVPRRNLRTTDERKMAMGPQRYELQRERWNEKNRITNLIVEALGEYSSSG